MIAAIGVKNDAKQKFRFSSSPFAREENARSRGGRLQANRNRYIFPFIRPPRDQDIAMAIRCLSAMLPFHPFPDNLQISGTRECVRSGASLDFIRSEHDDNFAHIARTSHERRQSFKLWSSRYLAAIGSIVQCFVFFFSYILQCNKRETYDDTTPRGA